MFVVVVGDEQVPGGVVERAHHPGDIPDRRVQRRPFGQRFRGFSFEVDDLPADGGAQDLPQVEVSVHSLGNHWLLQLAQRVHLLVQTGQVRLQLGDHADRHVESLDQAIGSRRQVLRVQPAGGQHPRHRLVYVRGRLAQPVGLRGEVSAHLVGVQVTLGIQVTYAGCGERPAVRGRGQVGLEHGQAGLVDRAVRTRPPSVDPAQQRSDVGAAVPGERRMHLDVGIQPWLDPPEDLQQRDVAVRQGRVALLDRQRERALPGRELGVGLGMEGEAIDAGSAVGEMLQECGGGVLVVQGVVDVAVVGMPDVHVLEPFDELAADGQRDLVDVELAVPARLDEDVPDPRLAIAQERRRHRAHMVRRRPSAEPALVRQPVRKQGDGPVHLRDA